MRSRAGPPLDETLGLLAPLAPTLVELHLGGNKLGGTITDDIAVDNILITWSELLEISAPDQYPIETSQGQDT